MRTLLFALSVFLLLAGCGNREAKLVGVWNFDPATSEGFTRTWIVGSSIELKPDHTVQWVQLGLTEGRWRLAGKTVEVQITASDGKPIAPPLGEVWTPFHLSRDGRRLTVNTGTGAGMSYVKQ